MTYEERQKQLAEHKYYYSITEYVDGSGYLRDETFVDEKLTESELKEWFEKECKTVEYENTLEERDQHRPCTTYIEIGHCSINYDEDRDEYCPDIENDWFGDDGREISGMVFRLNEEDKEEEQ